MHHYTHLQYTNLGFASIFYQDKKFTISFTQIIEYQEMLPRAIEYEHRRLGCLPTSPSLTVPVFFLDSYFTKKRKDSLPTPLVCRLARYLGPNGCRNDTCTGSEKEVTTPERDICMFWPCRRNCLVHVFGVSALECSSCPSKSQGISTMAKFPKLSPLCSLWF